MARYSIEDTTLTNIADAIRNKTGNAGYIVVNDMASKISGIETGTDTSDATATASDILSGKTSYVKGEKITGTITSKTASTYTPTTSDQTIASGVYLAGTQTVKGDSNLVAENIAEGVSIFGVTGTHAGTSATTETWELTLEDGSVVEKEICVL